MFLFCHSVVRNPQNNTVNLSYLFSVKQSSIMPPFPNPLGFIGVMVCDGNVFLFLSLLHFLRTVNQMSIIVLDNVNAIYPRRVGFLVNVWKALHYNIT